MCCVWGMAQSVNTKIWAKKGRMLVGSHSLALWLGGFCVQVTRGGLWRRRRRKTKAKADFCSSAHPSPCRLFRKTWAGSFIFWGRNRFGWLKLSHLYFFKQKRVTFLGLVYEATTAMACFSSVPVPGVPPLSPWVLYQFWIFIHCFETPSFPVKELKPRVYSWLLSQVAHHKWPIIQPSSLQASKTV